MAAKVNSDMVTVYRDGNATAERYVDALSDAIRNGQLIVKGSIVVIAMPADTSPVEYANTVKAARGT